MQGEPRALDKNWVVIKQLNASFELEIIKGKQNRGQPNKT
jgi:hypothetical protein